MKALLFKKRDHILAKIPVLGNVTHMMIYMMMHMTMHMGPIPQDGNFGQNVVLFFKK